MSRSIAFPRSIANRTRQSGVALMVVLILLVLMTLLSLVSLRGTLMQERMTSSQYDRSLAFQSAEAAVREGESIAAGRPVPAAGSGCDKGVCSTPVATDTPRWLDDANWDKNKTFSQPATDANLGGLSIASRYIVEYMGEFDSPGCTTSGDVSGTACTQKEKIYRITARSRAAARADVTLQTNFAVP